MRLDSVIGYTFRADMYCPSCIIGQFPTGAGHVYDGWALAAGVSMSTESNLDEIAAHFGVDRNDEWSFDSGDFPKVIFPGMLDDGCDSDQHRCGNCGNELDS